MNVRNLFTDDDAVSPVIGVILMVAITVILAAVIGAFVLNIGGSQESAPQVTWEWSDEAEDVNLKHGGGDRIENPSQISVSDSDGNTDDNADLTSLTDGGFSAPITAGDSANISVGSTSGTIELVWESSDGGDSQIISTHEYDTS